MPSPDSGICETSSAPAEPVDELSGALHDSTVEMLESCGVAGKKRATSVSNVEGQNCLASFLGFTGSQVRGSLTIVGPIGFFAQTYPGRAVASRFTESDASDWCCEFANQLLGRFKNKLLRRGVNIELSTPQGILADRLRLGSHSGGELLVAVYDVDALEFVTSFDVTMDAGLTFSDCSNEDQGAGEGDVFLL